MPCPADILYVEIFNISILIWIIPSHLKIYIEVYGTNMVL